MYGDTGGGSGSKSQTDLICRGLDTEPVYIGHTLIERAVVPEILLAATQTGVAALDRVASALIPFDDTA